MHEGASGGGKSEMLEEVHRESDERVLLGEHTVTGERFEIRLGETCEIFPIADDMVMAHRDMQDDSHKLTGTIITGTSRCMRESASIRRNQ